MMGLIHIRYCISLYDVVVVMPTSMQKVLRPDLSIYVTTS